MVWLDNISLEPPSQGHLAQLKASFVNAEQLAEWGGPNMRHPSTQEAFEQDLNIAELASFSLLIDRDLAGFGQFYARLNHCHLDRLYVAPEFRGRRLIDILIQQLLIKAQSELGHDRASLFVLESNVAAIWAYHRNGFLEQPYPGEIGLENCLYMTKPVGIKGS